MRALIFLNCFQGQPETVETTEELTRWSTDMANMFAENAFETLDTNSAGSCILQKRDDDLTPAIARCPSFGHRPHGHTLRHMRSHARMRHRLLTFP